MTLRKRSIAICTFLLAVLSAYNISAQTPLLSGVPISDSGTSNSIGSANTSRNIAVSQNGTIYVVYTNGSQIRLATSINGGQSFLPSVLVRNTGNSNVEPEIAVNDAGIVFIAWVENNSLNLIRTVNSGINFEPPISFGTVNDSSARVHMSTFGSNVYLIDQNGRNLYSNNNNGVGTFNMVPSGLSYVYADVLTDQNGVVYTPMDNPMLRLFRSPDQGATLTETTLNPGGNVFFSSYALSDGPCGTFIFVGGGDLAPSQTLGYRMDVNTGVTTEITLGENITSEGRTLYADNKGTLIDGYKTTASGTPGDLMISFSSDQGTTFDPPIVVATGNSHNIARSPVTENILVVYEAFGEIFLTVYNNLLNNIELIEPVPPLSFCSDDTFDLSFTLSGTFNPGTLFTASLSDEFGSFANATEIGSVTTNTNGTITCTLPSTLAPSDLYRIQIESLSNCIQSNSIPLAFGEAQITGPSGVCLGETVQLTGSDVPNAVDPWLSSDPNIASVDNNGLVTGVGVGAVEITYTNDEGCMGTFNFEVNAFPVVTPLIELRQCDDDNDGMVAFNLFESAPNISANHINETFVFYPSLTDAQNDTNAISTADALAYVNSSPTETLGVRTISAAGCVSFSEIQLTVSASAITSPGVLDRSIFACDDFLDADGNDTADNNDTDGITNFDFSFMTDDVINFFAPSQQPFLEVSYYNNIDDALSEQNPIVDPSNYRTNASPFTQTIYVRVDNTLNNDCVGLAPLITLNVNPVPTAVEVDNLILCDDASDGDPFNGIVQTFDLSAQTATILGGQDPSNFTVSYHTSASDANSGMNPIANTTVYENIVPSLQTIYVRVTNNTTGCFTDHTSFDLILNPWPITNPVPDLELCDNNSDGSAQNGFAQSFDLESQTPGVLGGQDPNQFRVTYHISLQDAELGVLPLQSPFSNSEPFTQTIYVRISDTFTNCANDVSTFNVVVNPEPSTTNVSNLSYCDDDTDGFVQDIIDLDSQIEDILDPQDPANFTVTFHDSQANASSGNNPLTSPFSNTVAHQQTIYVRVQNNTTGCVNDDFTFEVIINPLPEFTITTPQLICLNTVPYTLDIESSAAVYDYVWTDPTGNDLMGPSIQIRNGGTYTVTATTTDGTNCSFTREVVVNESNIATITEEDVTITDDSENNTITINPTNLGIGDYEYAVRNEDGVQTAFQDNPVFENLDGGIYTILVRDKNGCGTASTLAVPVVEFPKFFTPNNDLRNDTWSIKGTNSNFFPTSNIQIFNRYGKKVAELDIDGPGWDGTYNSKPLPSDDYWFLVTMVDQNGNMRKRQGNFSLLRK